MVKKLKFFILLVIFLWVLTPIEAQSTLFKPFTSFRVIQTQYFEIIFPQESEPSARHLATFADDVYEQLSTLLGIELQRRLPVIFTPHTDLRNGYYNPISSPHIVIFDTQEDLERSHSDNNLERIFIHELSHALSLNSRSPFFRGMHRVFGNWVLPTAINAPQFMVEGVTISIESLSGFGRSNDPRVRQYFRQAIHEDRFLTPFQASGVYDIPIRESYYEYGGLFSSWIQEMYGMEKYAELWQAMGGRFYFSFSVYNSGFYRIFRNVYGINFIDAWEAFRVSLTLEGLETNNDELLPARYRYFSQRDSFIQGLEARGTDLFFRSEGKLHIYNTRTGDLKAFDTDPAYDFDISLDAGTYLLSSYRSVSSWLSPALGRHEAVVTEYRTDSRRRTGRTIQGLYRARYFRDGVIGLRSDLHNTLVVYEDFNGNSEVLFRGNQRLMFSNPHALDDERIVLIASLSGKRELWLYNYISNELYRVECESGDNDYWAYIRDLSVSNGKLHFSHNSDDRMYKLGLVDLESMQGVFNQRDFSGGIFNAVSVEEDIYYLGAFNRRDRLLRFPETAASITGESRNLVLIALDTQNYQDKLIEAENSGLFYSGLTRPYYSIRYMNPFNTWIPLPLIRSNGSLGGAGLLSIITDPTDRHLITLEAYADIPYQMAMINTLSWQNTIAGFPMTLSFSDRVIESGNDPYRSTNFNLSSSLRWSNRAWNYNLSLAGSYILNTDFEEGKSAYQWGEMESGLAVSTGLSLSYRRLGLQLSGSSFVHSFEPRLDGIFSASMASRFPLSFYLFGAYDERGMDLHGISSTYGSTLVPAYTLREYPHPENLNLNWLGGAELRMGLFSFNVQRNISHAYFNRFYGRLALRNQIYDSQGHPDAEGLIINDLHLAQSLLLRLGMVTSFFPVVKYPAYLEPYVLGAWKFSNTISGDGFPWYVSFGLNLSL